MIKGMNDPTYMDSSLRDPSQSPPTSSAQAQSIQPEGHSTLARSDEKPLKVRANEPSASEAGKQAFSLKRPLLESSLSISKDDYVSKKRKVSSFTEHTLSDVDEGETGAEDSSDITEDCDYHDPSDRSKVCDPQKHAH